MIENVLMHILGYFSVYSAGFKCIQTHALIIIYL